MLVASRPICAGIGAISQKREEEMNEQIVRQSTLDDRYEVQVVRVAPYQGKLLIREADEEIYSQRVGMMFDTLIGPMAADLDVWEEMAIDAINNTCARRRTPPGTGQENSCNLKTYSRSALTSKNLF
jgi:hypothetical protein